MRPNFQGFWKALSEYDGAAEAFAELLVFCDEFSVKLDYSTPTSGGEWVVTVAHFGDRTEFRFPRLNFNGRDAFNVLSQRLEKAKKKAIVQTTEEFAKENEVIGEDGAVIDSPEQKLANITKEQLFLVDDEGKLGGGDETPAVKSSETVTTTSSDTDSSSKELSQSASEPGKSKSSDSTPDAAGSPSEVGTKTESSSNATSSAKDAAAESTPKPEASSQSVTDTTGGADKSKKGAKK